jgi:4-hydroxybenzoate polyprenyltransferase
LRELIAALSSQVTDVEIDKINKPYLPIAAGELSKVGGGS